MSVRFHELLPPTSSLLVEIIVSITRVTQPDIAGSSTIECDVVPGAGATKVLPPTRRLVPAVALLLKSTVASPHASWKLILQ